MLVKIDDLLVEIDDLLADSRDRDAGFTLEELAQMRRGEMDCVRHFSE